MPRNAVILHAPPGPTGIFPRAGDWQLHPGHTSETRFNSLEKLAKRTFAITLPVAVVPGRREPQREVAANATTFDRMDGCADRPRDRHARRRAVGCGGGALPD